MGPACLTTTALALAGAASAGGLTALAWRSVRDWIDLQIAVDREHGRRRTT